MSGARVCEDKLAVGGGLSIYQFEVDSLSTRFGTFQCSSTDQGDFYGPPEYSIEVNHQTLDGDKTESA